MFTHPVVVLDLETTGLNVEDGDRVTEVAAVRIQGGQITERFGSLVNCQRRIPGSIASFTHITQAMIDSAPAAQEVFTALTRFIGNDPVFAHNAEFDERFWHAECERAGLPFVPRTFLCSVRLAEYALPGLRSYALGPLARSMGLNATEPAHRAAADAELTARVVLKLTEALCTRRGWPFLHVSMLDMLTNSQVSSAA